MRATYPPAPWLSTRWRTVHPPLPPVGPLADTVRKPGSELLGVPTIGDNAVRDSKKPAAATLSPFSAERAETILIQPVAQSLAWPALMRWRTWPYVDIRKNRTPEPNAAAAINRPLTIVAEL